MYPIHLEQQYQRFFEKQFVSISDKFNRQVIKALSSSLKTDSQIRYDGPAEEIMIMLQGLKGSYGNFVDKGILLSQVTRNFHLLDAWSRDKTTEMCSALLSRLNTPQPPSVTGRPTPENKSGELWMTTVNLMSSSGITDSIRDRTIRQNLELISSLATEHLDGLSDILSQGLTSGKTQKEITDAIENLTWRNRSKAKFWARDQASKFFGAVSRERQTASGIPGYIWRGLRGARDNHAAVIGKYFSWTNPPAVGAKGERCHPGEDYNCRCWAEPAFGPEYEEKTTYENEESKSNKLEDVLNQHEMVIRNQRKQETIQAFDSTGRFITLKHGNSNSVQIDPSDFRKLKDSILTHNHPSGWNYSKADPRHFGNSFSPADIAVACRAQLKEIRVVTPTHRYRMQRPEAGWDKLFFDKKIYPTYIKHVDEVKEDQKRMIVSGELSLQRAESSFFHEVWSRVSKDLGIDYFREEL